METIVGIFNKDASPDGWFDETARPLGWVDLDLVDVPLAVVAAAQQNFDWPWEEALADEQVAEYSGPVSSGAPTGPPADDAWSWEDAVDGGSTPTGFLQVEITVPASREDLWLDDAVEDFLPVESSAVQELLAELQQFDWSFEEIDGQLVVPAGYQQVDPAPPSSDLLDWLWPEGTEDLEELVINDFAQVEEDPRSDDTQWLFEDIEHDHGEDSYQQVVVAPLEPALPGSNVWDFDNDLPDYTVALTGYQQTETVVVVQDQSPDTLFPLEEGEGLEELLILDFAQIEEDQPAFELLWDFTEEVVETPSSAGYLQGDPPPAVPTAVPEDGFTFDFDVVLDEFQVNDFPQIEEDPVIPPTPGGGSVGGGAYGGGDSGGYLRNFLDRALKEVRKESRQREVLQRIRPIEAQPEAVQQELLVVLSPIIPEAFTFPPGFVQELLAQLEKDLLEEEEFVVLQLLML